MAAIFWNSAEWTLFLWAAARLGLVYAAADPRVPEESSKALASLEPDIIVVQDHNAVVDINMTTSTSLCPLLRIQCTQNALEGWLSLSNFSNWADPGNAIADHRLIYGSVQKDIGVLSAKVPRKNIFGDKMSPQPRSTANSSSEAGSRPSSRTSTERSASAASQSSNGTSSWGRPAPKIAENPTRLTDVAPSVLLPSIALTSSDLALIVFTSGTTGTPKGCLHTNKNLMSQTEDYDPNVDKSIVERWLVHTPVSHIFAINNALRAWRYGGCVVFPSKSFDPDATLYALLHEQCTIMSATPTLARMLLSSPSYPPRERLNLNIVTIAATRITPEDTLLCTEGLGANYAIQAYGMCEGAPLVSWCRRDEMLCNGHHEGVGKALPGVTLRICRPGTKDILRTGEEGELHVSGSSVISAYLNPSIEDPFYDDDNMRRWFRTGDRANIDDLGVVRILGRYKELIIRGGENITPTVIEEALSSIPGVQVGLHIEHSFFDVANIVPGMGCRSQR